ncbi:MAG: hypothetical protein R2715_07215 [Ilumatobacteraceae bacterium]
MEREVAVDTRGRKSGVDHVTLHDRWQAEAAAIGITPSGLSVMVRDAAREIAEVAHVALIGAPNVTDVKQPMSSHRILGRGLTALMRALSERYCSRGRGRTPVGMSCRLVHRPRADQ